MRVPGGSGFLASGRWVGLAASVLLHGVALAAVVSFDGGGRNGTASEPVPTIPVVWQEAVVAAPEPAPPSLAPNPVAAPLLRPAASEAVSPPAAPLPRISRPPRRAPAPLAAVPSAEPSSASEPFKAETAASSEAAEAALPAASTPAVAAQVRQPELAASPAAPLVGWAVIARAPPAYPVAARRRGAEGEVLLRAEIGAAGAPLGITVLRSSGHPDLDAAAVAAVEKWRFRAAGPFAVEVPLVFRLDGRAP